MGNRSLIGESSDTSEGKQVILGRLLVTQNGQRRQLGLVSKFVRERKLTGDLDPVGVAVVLHCDHETRDYLVSHVMPQREGGVGMNLMFNGHVVCACENIQEDNFGLAPMTTSSEAFARFLNLGGVLPDRDLEDFEGTSELSNQDRGNWLTRRVERIWEDVGEEDESGFLVKTAQLIEDIRDLSVLGTIKMRGTSVRELVREIEESGGLAAILERSESEAGDEDEDEDEARRRLWPVDWAGLGSINLVDGGDSEQA